MANIIIGFNLVLLAACVYCLWRGGAPERLTALVCIVAAAATMALTPHKQDLFRSTEIVILLIDGAVLAVLVTIAIKANRFWPLFATAAHSIAVAVHLAKATYPSLVGPVYGFVASGSSLLVILILWIGALRHRRRLKRNGSDPPWRRSLGF